ncbi:MAG TPA: efflux RND transporter permease subunit [Alphaproteobacteria bacterium]|jgi:multidrug efflux pump
MMLSDISIKRPVFATVISMVLVIFGVIAFGRLAVREYPDIDPPVVSVQTTYRGASAEVIETQVTQIIENAVAGIEGIKAITSTSEEERSRVTIEFKLTREIEGASGDVRDKVGQVLRRLPDEVDAPIITKADSDNSPILWFALMSDRHTPLELTDYANRVLNDRLATVTGVSEVRTQGARQYSMRIWLDKNALAARGLTVADVEDALNRENVELPSGRVESRDRELTVRTESGLKTPEQFSQMVVGNKAGYPVRLGEVANVERAPSNLRSSVRANGKAAIGIGILRQSKSNTLEVAEGAKREMKRLASTMPEGMTAEVNYDESTFISESIHEVYRTLVIALLLVVGVVFVFLRNLRATLIPSIAIPVSIIASFTVLAAMGFSINVLTLLALVLAIGLVVDDAIVVLENIHRRMEMGEPPLLASLRGARQIGFAVIATTLVLVAVFVPISFLEGNIGRLFTEFAISVAVAVLFSGLVALTLTPMLCSKMLKSPHEEEEKFLYRVTEPVFQGMNRIYGRILRWALANPFTVVLVAVIMSVCAFGLFQMIQKEYGPSEDRGTFTVQIEGPQGASVEYMEKHIAEVEKEVFGLLDSGYAERVFTVTGSNSTSSGGSVNEGRVSVLLKMWGDRDRRAQQIIRDLTPKLRDNPWLRAVAINPPGLGRRSSNSPLQMVISGNTYEEVAGWRDIILERAGGNTGLVNLTSDYDETKPQLRIDINRNRALDLGISVRDIGETLQTLLGSKVVTTYTDRGEQYDVIMQAAAQDRASPQDLSNVFIRSSRTNSLVPLANLVKVSDIAGPGTLNRLDRMRSITIKASLAPGYSLGEGISYLENIAAQVLPPHARLSYKGESREFKETSNSLYWTFAMALVIVFLVLAAQFESFVNPFIIMLSVPLAVTGALAGMFFTGVTLNVYSQIGIITLIGLVAKNGILIVEFANQLRAAGHNLHDAVTEASVARLRPILMTSIATVFGALPLAVATGAGSEARQAVGVVVATGVTFSTMLTLLVVPVFYLLLAKRTKPVTHVADAILALERREAGLPASAAE